MSEKQRDYLKEVEGMLDMPRPLRELLTEDKVGVMEKLFGFLNIENVMQRKSVAYALGQIGDPWAIEQLKLRLQQETVEGVKNAIRASLAALDKMPADKGFSDQDRGQYIYDVYWGKADDKMDVNDWQWKSTEANEIFHDGIQDILKAKFLRKTKGMENPEIREEIIGGLEKGISLIEKAISVEQPPHPLSFQYLTKAFAELGIINYLILGFANDATPTIRTIFDKAKANAEKANEYYERFIGWDSGGRYDFHAIMAMVYYLTDEYEKARAEIDSAGRFNNETAFFIKEADYVEKALEEIRRLKAQRRESGKQAEAKSGCFGTVAVIIAAIFVSMIGLALILFQ